MLRKILNPSSLLKFNVRYASDKKPPQDSILKSLEDSITRDELRSTSHQVPWPRSAYHQPDEGHELLQRPKRKIQNRPNPHHIPISEDHSKNTILIFPGQGTQYIGMGQKAIEKSPASKMLFEQASSILGYNLLKLCEKGPEQTLNMTEYCQVAVVVSSLAAVEALWEMEEDAVKNCVASAGFSVGEITALIFSGAFSFEDGVRLVQARGKAMQEASEIEASGMMTVFYPAQANLGLACQAARKWIKENHNIQFPVCHIANHLYVGGKVIAGHIEALDFIEANQKDFGIRKCKRIPVSGAFHTSLMQPSIGIFEEMLNNIQVGDPRIPVYSNVDKMVYKKAKDIMRILPKQITNQVKWESLINNLVRPYENDEHWPQFIECGPGNSLSAIMKKINGKIAKKTSHVPA